jgi:hypothetical protein
MLRVVICGLLTLMNMSTSDSASMSHGLPSCVVAKSSALPSSFGDVNTNVGASLIVHEPGA